MAADDVVPHVGIRLTEDMLCLGMTREAAQPLLDKNRDIRVDFRGEPPVVAFIESPKHWGTFEGIELFESAADEVVAEIARRLRLDPGIYRPGRHEYYFPDLNMLLWRSCVSTEEGEQGYVFDCVSLHAPGYYDTKSLAYIRRQSGLSAVPEATNQCVEPPNDQLTR
jgi:hypothetical protein